MILKITKNNKANALITVLAVLFVLSTMAVSFAKVAANERLAAVNYGDTLKTRMLSEAGISFAISKLRRDFQNEILCTVQAFTDKAGEDIGERRWTYTTLNDINPNVLLKPEDVEDDMAAGIPMIELQQMDIFPDPNNDQLFSPHPSYAKLDQDSNLPIRLPNSNIVVSQVQKTLPSGAIPAYTLKILSLNSQIDLNSHIPESDQNVDTLHLVKILENLNNAIAQREPYKSKFPNNDNNIPDEDGPLFSDDGDFLGKAILDLRDSLPGKKFTTKHQILNVKGMNSQKAFYLWDFICATQQQNNIISRPRFAERSSKLESYRNDLRSPININLAPWPVLVATFADLQCIDPENTEIEFDIKISYEEAKNLASRICIERRKDRENPDDYPFREWQDFKKYILTPQDSEEIGAFDIFTGSEDEKTKKAQLIYAMSDPNTHLRRVNPDSVLYQAINKTDITHPTFELTFYPQGVFEITSLGQIINVKGDVVQSNKRQVVAKIFDLNTKSTQDDFDFDHVLSSLENIIPANFEEINSFSSGNNINTLTTGPTSQMDEISRSIITSNNFGHIIPVSFSPTYITSDGNEILTGSPNKDNVGIDPKFIQFKANFNAKLIRDKNNLFFQSLHADFPILDNSLKLDNQTYLPFNGLLNKEVGAEKLLLPRENNSGKKENIGSLASDGVIFNEFSDRRQFDEAEQNEEEIETLCYKTQNNLPIPSGILGDNGKSGCVSFWIKLNKNESWEKFRSIFFATSPFGPKRGVQMEIQMKYDLDKNLILQARRKYYHAVNINSTSNILNAKEALAGFINTIVDDSDVDNPTETFEYVGAPSDMAFMRHGKQHQFSDIQEHRWYHIAVSWDRITEITSIRLFGEENDPNVQSNGEIIAKKEGLPFFNENPFKVEKSFISSDIENTLDLQTIINDELLSPIEKNEVTLTENALMYFGCVKRTYNGEEFPVIFSAALTIDDVAILNHPFPGGDLADPVAVVVSRFQSTSFTHIVDGKEKNVMGMFSGKFPAIDSDRSILGIFDWTRKEEDNSFTSSSIVQDEFPPGSGGSSGDSATNTDYITFQNKKKINKIQINSNSIKPGAKEALFEFMILNNESCPTIFKDLSQQQFENKFLDDIETTWNIFQDNTIAVPGFSPTDKVLKLNQMVDNNGGTAKVRTIRRFEFHPLLPLSLLDILRFRAEQEVTPVPEPSPPPVVIPEPVPEAELEEGDGLIDVEPEEIVEESNAKKEIAKPAQGIATKINGEIGDILITPENIDYEFNLIFSQDQTDPIDSSLKVSFSAPVIDDVTISYQTKLKIFYNIELLD